MMIYDPPMRINLVIMIILFAILAFISYYAEKKLDNDISDPKKRFTQKNALAISRNLKKQTYQIMMTRIDNLPIPKGQEKLHVTKDVNTHYLYSNSQLLESAKRSLGLYGQVPESWLKAWQDRKGHHEEDEQQSLLQFIMNYDPAVKYWYVAYNGRNYDWIPFDKAMKDTKLNIDPRLRWNYDANEMLSMHFEINDKARVSWRNLSKSKKDFYDRMLVEDPNGSILLVDLYNLKPIRAQIFANKDLVNIAEQTITLEDLFSDAYEFAKKTHQLSQKVIVEKANHKPTKQKSNSDNTN